MQQFGGLANSVDQCSQIVFMIGRASFSSRRSDLRTMPPGRSHAMYTSPGLNIIGKGVVIIPRATPWPPTPQGRLLCSRMMGALGGVYWRVLGDAMSGLMKRRRLSAWSGARTYCRLIGRADLIERAE